MDTEKEIKSLIRDCVAYFRKEGYSEPRIKDYHQFWRNGIEQYMDKNLLTNYHAGIGEKFLRGIPPMSDSHMRAIRRSVHVLDDFLFYGKIRNRSVRYVHHVLPGKIGEVALEFIVSQERLRRCKPILNKHRRILSYFISHLTLRAVDQVSAIGEDDVLTFISSVQNCKDRYLGITTLDWT